MRTLITVIVVILAASVCSEVLLNHHPVKAVAAALAPATPAPQAAYKQAANAEQQLNSENTPAIIAEDKRVIALQPGSEWVRKAQARIEAVEARAKTEEQRKNVFQEHGID